MIAKTFEIRDKATFIPVLAIKLEPSCEADRYLLGRCGFGADSASQSQYIQLVKIDGGVGISSSDPYEWGSAARTMPIAHQYIIKNFDKLGSGAVVCVEYLLGERLEPKVSERLEFP